MGTSFFCFPRAIAWRCPGDGATLGTGTGKYLHGGKHHVDYVLLYEMIILSARGSHSHLNICLHFVLIKIGWFTSINNSK